MQECRKCKRSLSLDSEFFFKNKSMKSGFLKTCRECQGHSFFKREILPKGKLRCSSCEKILPATSEYFHKGKDVKEGFKSDCTKCRSTKSKNYRTEHQEELLKREKQNREENSEKYAQYSKTYYNKIKDTVEYKHKKKKWRDSYYERYSARIIEVRKEYYKVNRSKCLQIVKKYQQTYKGQLSLKRNNHIRREREKKSLLYFTEKDWVKCIEYFNHECCYCGDKLDKPTMDHFIPLSKGGEFSPKNILPACLSCNSSKHVNGLEEWYPKKSFYSAKREEKILKYLGYKDNKQQTAFF